MSQTLRSMALVLGLTTVAGLSGCGKPPGAPAVLEANQVVLSVEGMK